jgi:putative SOS response-associated peptidase YedK
MPGVFPDYPAPIVRNGADGRELTMARWGMPSSQFALMQATKKRAAKLEAKGKPVDFKELLRMEPDGGTTNICKQADEQTEHWHIHYAGVRVGLIQQRSGAPPSSDQSEWHCGF